MKYLFIHQNFPGQFKHLAPSLASEGHEVVALSVNRPRYSIPGVKIVRYLPDGSSLPNHESLPCGLCELAAKTIRGHSVAVALRQLKRDGFHPDMIIAHSGWGEALYIKDICPTIPLLVYAEYYYGSSAGDTDFDPEFSRTTLESKERLRIKNTHLLHALIAADAGISPTKFQRDCHPSILQSKIEVIHDGIDTTRFLPCAQASVTLRSANVVLRPDDEVVTFVARELEPYRGYHQFMRALPQMMETRPKAHFIVVGGSGTSYGARAPANTTWKEHFFHEVKDKVDQARLHFVGKVPHEVLKQLFQVATVHVYLTYPFVLSWSLMEAMSIGTVVVGSRTKPVEEIIDHDRNGFLVDFFDPEGIAKSVAEAIKRRDELVPLRAAARKKIVENYDLGTRCLPSQITLLKMLANNPNTMN